MALQLLHNTERSETHQPSPRRGSRAQTLEGIISIHLHCWDRCPGLLSAITLLIGTSAPLLCGHLFWAALWTLYLLLCKKWPQILLLCGAILYGFAHLLPKQLPSPPTKLLFSPASIQPYQSPFHTQLVYKGRVQMGPICNAPCSIFFRGNPKERPKGDKKYWITGALQQMEGNTLLCKPLSWEAIENSWSLAELRYQTKERLRKHLTSHLSSKRVINLLNALATGDVEERSLRYEFGKVGLQHILAISGFHFGIVIALASYALGLFLSRTWKIGALLLAVNLYFFFIGSSPAVQRSWLMALFYLIAQFLNRPTSSLNLLGCALTVELALDPLAAGTIGFQLSFLSCFAILSLEPLFESKLSSLFPKRSHQQAAQLSLFAQHGLLLASFFRKAISLTLAVNVVLLPWLLYHFHQFPLLSLPFNLFFPSLIGVALFCLLTALIASFLFPPIASPLFCMTEGLTSQLLDLVSYPPLPLDLSLFVDNIPAWTLPIYLATLGIITIHSRNLTSYSEVR